MLLYPLVIKQKHAFEWMGSLIKLFVRKNYLIGFGKEDVDE